MKTADFSKMTVDALVSARRTIDALLNKKVPGLTALPKANNCQESEEKAAPVGLAVDKGQDVYLKWLQEVEVEMQDKLRAEEDRLLATMN